MILHFENGSAIHAIRELGTKIPYTGGFTNFLWPIFTYKMAGHRLFLLENSEDSLADHLYAKCVDHNSSSPNRLSLQQVYTCYKRGIEYAEKRLGILDNGLIFDLGIARVNWLLSYAAGNAEECEDKDLVFPNLEGFSFSLNKPKLLPAQNENREESGDYISNLYPFVEHREEFLYSAFETTAETNNQYLNLALHLIQKSNLNDAYIKSIIADDSFYLKVVGSTVNGRIELSYPSFEELRDQELARLSKTQKDSAYLLPRLDQRAGEPKEIFWAARLFNLFHECVK